MQLHRRDMILGATALAGLAGCTTPQAVSKFRRYDGPEVTYIVVNKAPRRMYLLHNDQVLKSYDISLGFTPEGHKVFEGDGRTPEGIYRIDRRNPNSEFHLSLGISYPNARDVAVARGLGKDPGGDIFIHGENHPGRVTTGDWTWGCIAVTDPEVEEIYAMVRTGTPISINA